jgi:hypothetical protein
MQCCWSKQIFVPFQVCFHCFLNIFFSFTYWILIQICNRIWTLFSDLDSAKVFGLFWILIRIHNTAPRVETKTFFACSRKVKIMQKWGNFREILQNPILWKKKCFESYRYIVLDSAKNVLSSEGHLTKKLFFCCFQYFYIKMNTGTGIFQGYSHSKSNFRQKSTHPIVELHYFYTALDLF